MSKPVEKPVEKPEQVLIIEPQSELRFRGTLENEKSFSVASFLFSSLLPSLSRVLALSIYLYLPIYVSLSLSRALHLRLCLSVFVASLRVERANERGVLARSRRGARTRSFALPLSE